MGISMPQLIIILVVVALIFGTKKLRNIGGDLGSAIKGFKKNMQDDDQEELSDQSQQSSESSDNKQKPNQTKKSND